METDECKISYNWVRRGEEGVSPDDPEASIKFWNSWRALVPWGESGKLTSTRCDADGFVLEKLCDKGRTFSASKKFNTFT